MRRRRFVFWFGFGLFALGERSRVWAFDRLAAAAMKLADGDTVATPSTPAEHWMAAQNSVWRWYERESLVGGKWKVTGITTPVHRETGERYTGAVGYLDESLVPASVRASGSSEAAPIADDGPIEDAPHLPDSARRARHGRPPSRWLRSLEAAELRIWLEKIEIPEAGVSGMTYWTHLTRDHSFDGKKIAGLTIDEQAKLHAAAHYGY